MIVLRHVMFLRLTFAALLSLAGSCAGAKVDRDVPIPLATPFDSSPRERVEYLRFYCAGFGAALTGDQSSRCTRDEYWQARSAGWVAGQGDGFLVWLDDFEPAVRRQDRELLLVLLSGLGDRAVAAVDEALTQPVELR
jgi:hypothetical protein